MSVLSDPVATALITTAGGCLVAYITYVASEKYKSKKEHQSPKSRMEQMFDGYERLIKQKDAEDDRKVRLIRELEENVAVLEEQLAITRKKLSDALSELETSKEDGVRLRRELDAMKAQYQKEKGSGTI